jgi:hypothetical protein
MIVRLLCILAITGCTARSKPERPRVALENAAWFAGGAVLVGLGYSMVNNARSDDGDSGLRGPVGVLTGATGGVMAFGAILGLLGVAFDDVRDR